MRISAFRTDEVLEVEGVWVDIGDGARIKVARQGNPNHRRISQSLAKPHRAQINSKRVNAKLAEELGIQAIAQAILLDWDGLDDDAGKPIPYSVERAVELLTDLKDFRELVIELSDEMETFRAQEIEEAVGNSEPASAGKSSGGKK